MQQISTDDFTIESSHESAEAMQTALGIVKAEPASELDETPVADVAENDAEAAAKADAKGEQPKIDKRTREGRKASIQAEIDELTRTKYDTKRELEAAQDELRRLRAEQDQLRTPKADPKPATRVSDTTDPEPDHTNAEKYPGGEYDPKYLRDVGRWEARQEIKAENQRRQQLDSQRAMETAIGRVTEAGRKAHADYDDVLSAAERQGLTYPQAVIDAIFNEPLGHELAYDLARNSDDLRRLASLSPVAAAREVGKRLTRLEAATASGPAKQTEPPTSKAKAPIKPVDAAPVVAGDDDGSEEESVERHIARENARERKAGRL